MRKGFFNIERKSEDKDQVVNIIYDAKKRKFLMIRQGRKKAYVAFDRMPEIVAMGKRMREG